MQPGFPGTGTISAVVIRGLAGQGDQILVSHRSRANSTQLAAEIPEVSAADNHVIVAQSAVVFPGLLAARAAELLDPLQPGRSRETPPVWPQCRSMSKSPQSLRRAPARLRIVI